MQDAHGMVSLVKEDVYGVQIAKLLSTTQKPLSPREITDVIGCSKQRTHAWITKNRGMLIAVDTNTFGGTEWLMSNNPLVKARNVVEMINDDVEGIEVGESLKVAGLKFGPLGIVLTLETARGGSLRAIATWDDAKTKNKHLTTFTEV